MQDPYRRSVTQEWTYDLTFMMQSVLITAIRGPDGIHKNHVSKKLIRWLRRCVVLSAFDRTVLPLPYDVGERKGGSFTGPSLDYFKGGQGGSVDVISFDAGRVFGACTQLEPNRWPELMHLVLDEYMLTLDELPHHFQLHFMHAAEIIGYRHPNDAIRKWWNEAYNRLANDMHLSPESHTEMSRRLGDHEPSWRAKEEVRAD